MVGNFRCENLCNGCHLLKTVYLAKPHNNVILIPFPSNLKPILAQELLNPGSKRILWHGENIIQYL